MEDELAKRVVGQEEAVKAVVNAIRRSRAGISGTQPPHWFIYLLGPTGVGKPNRPKGWQNLFNTEDFSSRRYVSEYMGKSTRFPKVNGSPPGYVGL